MKKEIKKDGITKPGRVLFVWDFHGVLEKDNEYAVQYICRQVLKEFGYPRGVSLKVVRELYGKKWIEYFSFLSGEKDMKKLPPMVDRAREVSRMIVHRFLKPMDHAAQVLARIKKAGHDNFVVSNSRQDRIEDFLEIVRLRKYIDKVVGVDGHSNFLFNTTEEKAETIKSLSKGKGYARKVIIGDIPGDIEAGKLVRARTYYFVNRFNSAGAKSSGADRVIRDLREVLKEL